MSTDIIVTANDVTYASSLVSTVHAVDSTITTITQVLANAAAVGLNRLLSHYTTTPAALAAIMVPQIDVSDGLVGTVTVVTLAADVARIASIVALLAGGSAPTTAQVTGCAVRTGLALLAGHSTLKPPLRLS